MKRKTFRNLIIVALCLCLILVCCAGCKKKEHEHSWDEGKVTTEASCSAEGVMTYTCAQCGETKMEPIAKVAHSYAEEWSHDEVNHYHACTVCGDVTDKAAHQWDEGQVTKEPTAESEGEMTYTCTVCGATKTEAVEAQNSGEETEIANFTKDFSGVSQGSWKYGYAKDFNFDNNTFTFMALQTFNGEAWTDSDGIEIKADWIRNETGGAPAVVRYISEVSGNVKIYITFNGSDAVTRMSARLHIAKADGSVVACEFISAGIEASDWIFEYEAQVEEGYAVSLIFFNEGNGGYFHGNLSMTVTAGNHTHTPVAVDERAPTCTEAGWTAGTVCAVCGEVFEGHEEIPATGHSYGKTWSHNAAGHWHVCTVCGNKADEAGHSWDGGKVTKEPTMEADGVRTITCKVCGETKKETIPNLGQTEIADFTKDFAKTQRGKWKYGYTNDFNFSNNTFTFKALPVFNGDAWTDGDGIEIKSDWIRNETGGAPAVVRYISEVSGKVNVRITFSGSDAVTRMAARLHIAGANGTVKACEFIGAGTQAKDWTYEYSVNVEKGDAISLIFFSEGDAGYFHGSFSMTITADKHTHTPADVAGKAPTCTEAGWTAGKQCAVCGEIIEGHEEIPATGHKYSEIWLHDAASHWHECTVCGERAEEAAHTWDEGTVTTEPTMEADGVRTFTCGICGETKVESIPKLVDVEIADFTKDFGNTQEGSWRYGYTNNFDFGNNTFTFHEAAFNGDAWTDGDGIEIKSDWIRNETVGTQTVLQYVSKVSGKLRFDLAFTGSDAVTRIAARLHVAKADGTVVICEFIGAGTQAANWTYEYSAEVEEGDVISILFFNEGDAGYFHGKFAMTVTEENHTHHSVWKSDGVEHWLECTVCGYREDAVREHLWSESAVCVDDAQHQYICIAEGCGEVKLEEHTLDTLVTKASTLFEGGTVTVSCQKCEYSAERETPPRKFADFQEDFTAAGQGTEPGQWKYGYATDYDWGNDNFTFSELTSNGSDSWSGLQGIEIKRDWLLTENWDGANAAVGYIVPTGKTRLEVFISLTHVAGDVNNETRLSARLLVVGPDGNTKSADFIADGLSNPSWSTTRWIDVADGDTVYVILFRESNAWPQGTLQVVIGDAEDAVTNAAPPEVPACMPEDLEAKKRVLE